MKTRWAAGRGGGRVSLGASVLGVASVGRPWYRWSRTWTNASNFPGLAAAAGGVGWVVTAALTLSCMLSSSPDMWLAKSFLRAWQASSSAVVFGEFFMNSMLRRRGGMPLMNCFLTWLVRSRVRSSRMHPVLGSVMSGKASVDRWVRSWRKSCGASVASPL